MMNQKIILQSIIAHSKDILQDFENNYCNQPEKNLIYQYKSWPKIKKNFLKGGGSELTSNKKGELPKFQAIHSSSALCVNNFALIKENADKFKFNAESNFDAESASFEKMLNTGISTPNLDFYVENPNAIFAFESKFLETTTPKHPNKTDQKGFGNLKKYVNRQNELKVSNNFPLDKFISNVLAHYINANDLMFLDVSQLIKHMLGIANIESSKKKNLVYIYWLPTNYKSIELYSKHEQELIEFKNHIEPFNDYVNFQSLSYLQFWEDKNVRETIGLNHIQALEKRYKLAININ